VLAALVSILHVKTVATHDKVPLTRHEARVNAEGIVTILPLRRHAPGKLAAGDEQLLDDALPAPLGEQEGVDVSKTSSSGALTISAENGSHTVIGEVQGALEKEGLGTLFPVLVIVLICLLGLCTSSFVSARLASSDAAQEAASTAGAEGSSAEAQKALEGDDAQLDDEDQQPSQADPLDMDLYGLVISTLVRDISRLVTQSDALFLRTTRMAVSLLCMAFSFLLQVYILEEMRQLVAGPSVKSIRQVYDNYEIIMYGNDTSHMSKTTNGYHRGSDAYWDRRNFNKLSQSDKLAVCSIPLSQPTFFMTALLVWTFTVVADLRKSMNLFYRLTVVTPSIDSMRAAIMKMPGDGQRIEIVGLTRAFKASLVLLLFLPRIVVDLLLLWLGCRWLCAASSFENVIVNTVALEFILHINALLFNAMIPARNQIDTSRTYVLPASTEEVVTPYNILSTYAWGIAGVAWVLLYVLLLQQVLPDYRWDVQHVCAGFLHNISAVGR